VVVATVTYLDGQVERIRKIFLVEPGS
jgi:hypothetical protein